VKVQAWLAAESEGRFNPTYGYDVYVHRGMAYSTYCSARMLDLLENFPVDESDVFLVGFPKSGTNYLNILVANLYDGWGTTRISRGGTVPEISIPDLPEQEMDRLETCLAAQVPRLMKSHQRPWGSQGMNPTLRGLVASVAMSSFLGAGSASTGRRHCST
jgi:hypothetical protein